MCFSPQLLLRRIDMDRSAKKPAAKPTGAMHDLTDQTKSPSKAMAKQSTATTDPLSKSKQSTTTTSQPPKHKHDNKKTSKIPRLFLPTATNGTSRPETVVQWKPPQNLPHVVEQAKKNEELENPMLDGMRPGREAEVEAERVQADAEEKAKLEEDHLKANKVLDDLDGAFKPTLEGRRLGGLSWEGDGGGDDV